MARSVLAGDPSLRLKNGYDAQDDAILGANNQEFKLRHYLTLLLRPDIVNRIFN